jgi:hypothetical protein
MKSQIMKTAHAEARRRFGLCKTGKAYALFFAEELHFAWQNANPPAGVQLFSKAA